MNDQKTKETAIKTPGAFKKLGVIGLGDLGSLICRRLVASRDHLGLEKVVGFDSDDGAAEHLSDDRIGKSSSIAHLVDAVDLVMLCLPNADELAKVARRHDGLLDCVRAGQVLLDLGSSPVPLTRQLATAFNAKGVVFMDSPVTRIGVAGPGKMMHEKLSTVIAGEAGSVQAVLPYIRCFSKEITHVGNVGAAQVVKQMEDLLRIQSVTALAEALSMARAAGIDGMMLFEALLKGGGDSSALRHHGLGRMLQSDFGADPLTSASAARRLDDGIRFAESLAVDVPGARHSLALLRQAIDHGLGDDDVGAIIETVDPKAKAVGKKEETVRNGKPNLPEPQPALKAAGRP